MAELETRPVVMVAETIALASLSSDMWDTSLTVGIPGVHGSAEGSRTPVCFNVDRIEW